MKRRTDIKLALLVALAIFALPLNASAEPAKQLVEQGLKKLFSDDEVARNKVEKCLNTLSKAPAGSTEKRIADNGLLLASFRTGIGAPINRNPYIASALILIASRACDNPSTTNLDEARRVALYTNILTHPALKPDERDVTLEYFRLNLCIKVYSPQMSFIAAQRVKVSALTDEQILQAKAWCLARAWP